MQASTHSQLQLAAVCSKQAAAVCSKQAATKSEKSNLHTKNAQAARLQQTMSRKVAATKSHKVAATKSRKVATTKSRKVAATKSSKTNLHTKNSQAATMPQLAAAAKPHACCLFAAIHCEKPFISIREDLSTGLRNIQVQKCRQTSRMDITDLKDGNPIHVLKELTFYILVTADSRLECLWV